MYSTVEELKELFNDEDFKKRIAIGKYTNNLFEKDPKKLYTILQYGVLNAGLEKIDFANMIKFLVDGHDLSKKRMDPFGKDIFSEETVKQIKIPEENKTMIKPLDQKAIYDIIWNIGEFEGRWFARGDVRALKEVHPRCITGLDNLRAFCVDQDIKHITLEHTKDIFKTGWIC
jgi:hypothetical protein